MSLATERVGAAPTVSTPVDIKRGNFRSILRRHPRLVVGGGLVVVLVFMAIFAPLLTPFDPTVGDISDSLQAPSAAHWLGTDDQGRDMMARIMYGARISLSVAIISVSIGAIAGVSIGLGDLGSPGPGPPLDRSWWRRGGGGQRSKISSVLPPPQPSPARGEGAQFPCGSSST